MNTEENLSKAISFAQSKLKTSPPGTLLVRRDSNATKYYQRTTGETQFERYLNHNDEKLIKDLQEKTYYREFLKVATEELEVLRKIRKLAERLPDCEKVFYNLPADKRSLIEPYISSEAEEIRKKIETEFRKLKADNRIKKGVDNNLQFVTLNGERVRSKSELIIADRLCNAKIPYLYESKHLLVDEEMQSYEVVYPDFQMFNVRTGKKYYWEHFGLMDKSDYCLSCQYKLETYAKHGIIMGKNLIITIESSLHSLNTAYVDCMIKEFLM